MRNAIRFRAIGFLVALALSLIVAGCGSDSDIDEGGNANSDNNPPANGQLTVATQKGRVAGMRADSMRQFRGLPYAAPPVGDLRWKPPQTAQSWSGVKQAKTFANHCPQTSSPFGKPSTTEDCLYLNVFAPEDNKQHPVMVWIHGGAFLDGEGSDYNPAPLVNKGMVVVTINYRLGILGFLAHPSLTAASSQKTSGDYGIMDQQAALEWVQKNIANFGGNPDNVTIFGESAGGLSVISQLASPEATGLFDKAIVESGSYSFALPNGQPTLQSAEDQGKAFAKKAGCTNQTLKCLRNLSVSKILQNQGTSPQRFIPNTGTPVLPKSIKTVLVNGNFNTVPVMEGTNRNEWRLFVALAHDLTPNGALKPDNYVAAIASTFGVPQALAKVVVSQYPLSDYENADLALAAAGTDGAFACAGRSQIGVLSQYVPTYAYEFADENAPELFLPPVDSFSYGAAHASEIQYVFDFFGGANLAQQPSFTSDQKELSSDMVDYWTSFARNGNPNPSSGTPPSWPQYRQSNQVYLSLTAPTPSTFDQFGTEHKCDSFWDTALSLP